MENSLCTKATIYMSMLHLHTCTNQTQGLILLITSMTLNYMEYALWPNHWVPAEQSWKPDKHIMTQHPLPFISQWLTGVTLSTMDNLGYSLTQSPQHQMVLLPSYCRLRALSYNTIPQFRAQSRMYSAHNGHSMNTIMRFTVGRRELTGSMFCRSLFEQKYTKWFVDFHVTI